MRIVIGRVADLNSNDIPGVKFKPGVVRTPEIDARLIAHRAEVDPSVTMYVTSGLRPPGAQAAAMYRKVELGEILSDLYPKPIAALLMDLYTGNRKLDLPKWTDLIRRVQATGSYFSEGHMAGRGYDLGITQDLTPAGEAEIIRGAQKLGMYADKEETPPHIHVQWEEEHGLIGVDPMGDRPVDFED